MDGFAPWRDAAAPSDGMAQSQGNLAAALTTYAF